MGWDRTVSPMASRKVPLESAQRYEKKGELAKAAAAYSEHLAQSPQDSRALHRQAELYERLGEAGPAAQAFRRLGRLHAQQGFVAKATAAFRQAVRLAPGDVEAVLELCEVLEQASKRGDAAELLERSARELTGPADGEKRLRLLERLADLDSGAGPTLALADALTQLGRQAEAAERLERLVEELRRGKPRDFLAISERLIALRPRDHRVAVGAAKAALELKEPRRSLLAVRPTLDFFPRDPELAALAAWALETMGERDRATLCHREAARRYALAGQAPQAREQWLAVLRLDPGDQEGRAALAPSLVPDVTRLLDGKAVLRDRIDEAEAAHALSALDLGGKLADDFVLEISADELSGFSSGLKIEPDDRPVPAEATAAPAPAEEPVLEAEPLPEDEEPPGAGPAPMPRRALVLGDGPEAGWVSRALGELEIEVEVVGRGELESALERATSSGCELVFPPSSMAEVWREAGSFLVAGPVARPRFSARSVLRAAGLPVIDSEPARGAEVVRAALSRWGSPVELVGPFGAGLRVQGPGSAAYVLSLAKERLGSELEAQPCCPQALRVAVACDGQRALGLAEWREASLEGLPGLESPAEVGERERLLLAARMAAALGLRGVAVLVLARCGPGWVFESMEPAWGPGGLAVEARTGLSLVQLSVSLARGEPLPEACEPRGAAVAASVPRTSLASLANLRFEPSAAGDQAFLCAHAAEAAQATRRLARALKPSLSPPPPGG